MKREPGAGEEERRGRKEAMVRDFRSVWITRVLSRVHLSHLSPRRLVETVVGSKVDVVVATGQKTYVVGLVV